MRKTLILGLMLAGAAQAAWAGVPENRLLAAVRDGDHAAVKAALAAHANVNAPLPDKSAVLAWAVDRQDAESVKLLLAAGAQPRAVAAGGVQPLSLACELGNPAIVGALIKAGANAKEIRADGTSAFALCAGTSTPPVLATMAVFSPKSNPMMAMGCTDGRAKSPSTCTDRYQWSARRNTRPAMTFPFSRSGSEIFTSPMTGSFTVLPSTNLNLSFDR